MPQPKRILLIDDNPAMAGMVGLLVTQFRRGPFILEHAPDYERGLRGLLEGGYALCLLDYHLGDRNGLELLRAARAAHCLTPVILLTGSALEETDLAALDDGAMDFIDKGELTLRGLERAVFYALKMDELLNKLRDLAAHDELTGVMNRREFDRRLEEEWRRGARFRRPFALVMLDLDHFKGVNDAHGHQVGDALLRQVAGRLAERMRPGDCLARYGGDEFAIIMVEAGREAAVAFADQVRAQIAAEPCQVSEKGLALTVRISVGVAAWPEDADSRSALVAAADAALYTAKREGRDRVRAADGTAPRRFSASEKI